MSMTDFNDQQITDFTHWISSTARRSRTTTVKYAYTLSAFAEWLDSKPCTAVTTKDLERFVCERPRTKTRTGELSTTTVKREMSELRTFYKWLLRERRISSNPAEDLIVPSPAETEPYPCDDARWQELWFSGHLKDADRVALGLAMFCGLRRAEVTGLRPTQVKPDVLVGVKRKGGDRAGIKYRSNVVFWAQRRPDLIGNADELFFGPLDRLRTARAGEEWLLPWRDERNVHRIQNQVLADDGGVNPNLFNRRIEKLLADLGMPAGSVRPHALRHAFCTNLIKEGVALPVVSRLAGHSNVNITMRYVRTSEDPLGDLLDD